MIKKKNRNSWKLSGLVMLILLISLSIGSCRESKVILVPVGEVKVFGEMENGHWEVSEGFVQKFYWILLENENLKEKLDIYERLYKK